VDTVAASLTDWVSADRAELIAHTESARAVSVATVDSYRVNGIAQWDWVVSAGACPVCLDREASGPYGLGADTPPAHPRCRCSASPHVDPSWTAPAAVSGEDQS
jgi:uncharacterized protein with gpF-like domain